METNYKKIFEKYPEAALLLKNKKIYDCNERACTILGWSREELLNKNYIDGLKELINIDADKDYFKHKLEKVNHGNNESLKTICKRKDNTHFHAKLTIIKLDDSFFQIIIRDISERVFFEDAIRSSEERFKLFSSVVHNSVAFIFNEIIIDCNDQLADLFEYPAKTEIIGKNISILFKDDRLKKINATLNLPRNKKTEIQTFSRRGKILFLETTASNIQYQGQEVIVYLLHDITHRKRTEMALEQSTNRFKSLVENSPNGVFIITNGKIKYANQSGVTLLGFEEEDDVYNTNFSTFFDENRKTIVQNDMDDVRRGKRIDYKEYSIINKQQDSIDVGIKLNLTIYKSKPSIQITINNLTTRRMLVEEQMRAELAEEINKILKKEIENHKITQQQLGAAQNFTKNMINSSIDMIVAVDNDGLISEFNSSAEDVFKFQKDEAVGKAVRALYVDEDMIDVIQEQFDRKGVFRGEVQFYDKNNEIVDTILSASLVKNPGGRIIGSMGILRDITKTKKTEKEAKVQRAKLEAIFNSTENMMMWTQDKEGNITSKNNNFVNQVLEEFNVDLNKKTNIFKWVKKRLNKDVYQGQLDNFQKTFEGIPSRFILPLQNKNKEEKWMQVFLNPVDVGEQINEISCLMYDITERMVIDRKILDSLKEKEVLLQEVHHRVKNNLQVISSILNLQASYISDEKTIEILEESQNRIAAMSFIHETLYQTSDFSSVGFSEYIDTIVINLIHSYSVSGREVNLIKDMDSVFLPLDQSIPCGLIVNELVTNAMKYAFVKDQLHKLFITVKENKNIITIGVADNGIGLPKDFKYEESDSLGMQLVYSLVDQLDGKFEVKSEKGTNFLITFDKII